jgi:integrase
MLDRNPFRKFRALAEPAAERHLSPKHLDAFLEAVEAWQPERRHHVDAFYEAYKRLVYIYLATGLRRTELMTLTREDVDLDRNRLHVTNIKHSCRRCRWITIPDSIRPDVAWFLDTFPDDEPFNLVHPDQLSHWIKARMREACLPESLNLHSLRHTFITMALQAGEHPWRIRDHVDHSNYRVTEGYAHTDVDDGRPIDIGTDLNKHRGRG